MMTTLVTSDDDDDRAGYGGIPQFLDMQRPNSHLHHVDTYLVRLTFVTSVHGALREVNIRS